MFVDGPTPSPERLIAYFSPARSPLYVITLSAAISLLMTCTDVNGIYWMSISGLLLGVLSVAVALSFRRDQPVTPGLTDHQVGFARAASISAALFAVTLTAPLAQNDNSIFYLLLCACIMQVIVFMLPATHRVGTAGSTVNIVQLTLITGCLLGTSAASLSQYAGRQRLGDIERDLYGSRYLSYPSDTTVYERIEAEPGTLVESRVEALREASRLLRETTFSLTKFFYQAQEEMGALSVSPRTWARLRAESPRYLLVGSALLILWMASLVFWITLISIAEPWTLVLRVLLGTMGTITAVLGACALFDMFGLGGFRRFIQGLPPLVMPFFYVSGGIALAVRLKAFRTLFQSPLGPP